MDNSSRAGGVERVLPHSTLPECDTEQRAPRRHPRLNRLVSLIRHSVRRTPAQTSAQTSSTQRPEVSPPLRKRKIAPPRLGATVPSIAVPAIDKGQQVAPGSVISPVKYVSGGSSSHSTHDHKELFKLQSLQYGAALEVLDQAIRDAEITRNPKLDSLLSTRHDVEKVFHNLRDTAGLKGDTPVSKKEMKEAKSSHPERLQKVLTDGGVDKKTVKTMFREAYVHQLNSREWKPIRKAFSHNGKAMTSSQTPAAKMALPEKLQDKVSSLFPEPYNGQGVCCVDNKNVAHATNLYRSSFSVGEGLSYTGIRHGIADPYGVKGNPELQAQGAKVKAQEILLAALGSKPEVLEQALLAADGTGEPPVLNTTSVSLVTTGLGSGKEKKMQQMQNQAFEHFTDPKKQPVTLTVLDANGHPREVKLVIKQSRFNIPVNWGGVGGASLVTGGRRLQKSMNDKAIAELVGKPGSGRGPGGAAMEHLAKTEQEIRSARQSALQADTAGNSVEERQHLKRAEALCVHRQTVLELTNQIQDIYKKGKHHHHHHDAYKLAARVSALTHLIDGVPLCNCKSGKDRTGMLDAEIKFLLARIDPATGAVPEPGPIQTQEDRKLFHTILQESGNLEVQEQNVGVRGYKTEGVKSIDERVGDAGVRSEIRGLSKTVGS